MSVVRVAACSSKGDCMFGVMAAAEVSVTCSCASADTHVAFTFENFLKIFRNFLKIFSKFLNVRDKISIINLPRKCDFQPSPNFPAIHERISCREFSELSKWIKNCFHRTGHSVSELDDLQCPRGQPPVISLVGIECRGLRLSAFTLGRPARSLLAADGEVVYVP